MPWEPWAQGNFLMEIAFGGLHAVGFASPDLTKLFIRVIGKPFFMRIKMGLKLSLSQMNLSFQNPNSNQTQIWKLKCDIFNLESGFQNLKCEILNLDAHIRSPESEIRGLTSQMWNWRSLNCIRNRRRPDSSSFSQITQASHIFLLSPQLHKYH